jgi:type II secretory pathway pseudopilin PulG
MARTAATTLVPINRARAHPARCGIRGGPQTPLRGAFTLFEMIVVMVVLIVLLGLSAPRIIGSERRQFEQAVNALSDLLIMYAQREAIGQKPIALYYNVLTHSIELRVLDMLEGDPSLADWRRDVAIPPVKLPDTVMVAEVLESGSALDSGEWVIYNTPGQPRPEIQITLQGNEGLATVVLPSFALAPYTLNESGGGGRMPVDLDGTGRNREDW